MDRLSRIDELHQRFDGPIPEAMLLVARHGSVEAVTLMQTVATADFYRRMVLGQIETIRMRREDGSFYPALLKDLAYYREHYRAHARHARALRKIVAATGPQVSAA